ncbi:hypothetical protein H6P81_008827 [Aristolochia fimbriata]|uniref:Uncharacterized protein n=1 Tax=Aristolochia fimbriata TaxID=158543 RepID=A0AAV7EMD4_ARIFI|nr:hypothetical protein H6P81_008827 [Aristolochia fimbriata]
MCYKLGISFSFVGPSSTELVGTSGVAAEIVVPKMGCVSSKIVTRSSSFKEELRRSIKRRVSGFPVLEELFITHKGDDQLLALVSTANTVTKKLQTGVPPPSHESRPSSEPCLEASKPETINAWELMEGLEEEKGEEDGSITRRTRVDVRGKSFHTLEEFDALVQSQDRGTHTRSRSVGTLQEYDDKFVESNLRSRAVGKECEIPAVETEELPVEDYHAVNKTQDQEICTELGERIETEVSCTDTAVDVSSETHPCQADEDYSVHDTTENREEKGYRRKTKAKQLTTLSIPTSTHTPAVGSLGEWLDLGAQTLPSREYITPRFGSFGLPAPFKRNSSKDQVLFDPELVAAFEESLKEMTAEEEFVLKQIAEGLGEENEETKQRQHETGARFLEDNNAKLVA